MAQADRIQESSVFDSRYKLLKHVEQLCAAIKISIKYMFFTQKPCIPCLHNPYFLTWADQKSPPPSARFQQPLTKRDVSHTIHVVQYIFHHQWLQ